MSTRSRHGKPRPRPFQWQPTQAESVVEFQRTCTVCEGPVRWLSWDDALATYGGDWLYEQRRFLYGLAGEDLVAVEVWSCRRHAKHYGITAAAAAGSIGWPW